MALSAALQAIAALAAAIFAAWGLGRRKGKKAATEALQRKDQANADKIRDAADRARRADDAGNVDAADFLRSRGRLRD